MYLLIIILIIKFCENIRLNNDIHLFVDNKYIKEISSLEFQNGFIEKNTNQPIVYPEYPWENLIHFYTSFLQVPSELSLTRKSMYMIYYACAPSYAILFNSTVSICVANSTDGIKWEKPLMWYYPYRRNEREDNQPTNIVFITDVFEYLGSVFIDIRPGISRSQIFKMTYEHDPKRYVFIGTSPDGFNWTAGNTPANPIAGLSDTQTVMFYSYENNGQYVLYGRKNQGIPNSTLYCPNSWAPYRHVVVTVSSNDVYGPWSTPIEAFSLGEPDPIQCFDNYNPAALYYNHVYFLFPSAYWHWAESDSGAPIPRAAENDGVMDIRLAISRTALGPFTFPSRDSFISRGIGSIDPSCKLLNGSGSDRDAGFVFSSANGLLDPDFIQSSSSNNKPSPWIYHIYWGSQTTHAGGGAYLGQYWPGAYTGIFKARLRREGYVSLSTLSSNPTGYGWFLTQVLLLPLNNLNSLSNKTQLQLEINAAIATSGYLIVQFEDGITGYPILGYTFNQCKSLHGNNIRQLLQWSRLNHTNSNITYTSDLTPLLNYTNGIQIRIQMTHTKLYSWLFSYV